MKMKIVVDLKLIFLLHQCYLLHLTASHYNHFYGQTNSGSQSQENNSEIDGRKEHHHHHHWNRNQNGYNDQKENFRFGGNDDECNNCACNKCDNPPNCCKKVCESCPKPVQNLQNRRKSMPRIEVISMPGMPPMQIPMPPSGMPLPMPPPSMPLPMPQMPQMPLPMPQMSMPPMPLPQMPMHSMPMSPMQMPHMPPMPGMQLPPIPPMQMSMPQMHMQMPPMQMPMPMPGPFGSPFQNSLVYFPLASNFMNILRSMAPTTDKASSVSPSTVPATTLAPTTAVTVVTTTSTTQATTTTQGTTTVLTTQRQPIMAVNDDQIYDYKQEVNNQYLKSQRDDTAFESVLKSAIDDFSNIIVKTPEKTSEGNNKYMLTSLRRTKPTWMPKFGIVPIPDNMAQKLMLQLRGVQGRRRRQKRMAAYNPNNTIPSQF